MQRVVIRDFGQQQRERWARGYRWASSQPSWVARASLLAFMIVVGLPMAILFMLALLAAIVVFGTLAIGHLVLAKVRALFSGDRDTEGRENVRVRRLK
jgi:hypothetical protein